MKDICCVGHITRDKIVTPRKTVYMAGGTAFYMAYGINHLPHDIAFQLVTKTGPESLDEVARMRQKGIEVQCFESPHSVYFENRYGLDSNRRTQRVLAKAAPFTMAEIRSLEAKVFHLGSLLADDFPPEVVRFLSTKGRISIDVQGYLREVRGENVYHVDWKDKREILSCTDILKLNEHEMAVIANSKNPRTVALQLAELGVKEVIITLGSYGSLIYADNRFYEIPAYKPREVVDATGCGDTYSAGYLYMRSLGADYAESGRFAAAMCTSKLEHNGPYDGDYATVIARAKIL
ncbi:PfkB family carbohydrate kinase [Segatella maculosa]|uniref:PfkB family carbohydrate kinase n=1 Tax=Segatella maculosa TaxID=439703 RepID=UPI00249239EB|nr:PfkB family carbohydrate kinase [Segatella maculosa]